MKEIEAKAIRNKRAKTEEAILDGYSKGCLPAVRKLHERYAELLERREAEKTEIEARSEAGPEGPTQAEG